MGSAVLVGVFSSLEINGHACRQQDAGLAGKSTCSSSDLCPLPTHFKASPGCWDAGRGSSGEGYAWQPGNNTLSFLLPGILVGPPRERLTCKLSGWRWGQMWASHHCTEACPGPTSRLGRTASCWREASECFWPCLGPGGPARASAGGAEVPVSQKWNYVTEVSAVSTGVNIF